MQKIILILCPLLIFIFTFVFGGAYITELKGKSIKDGIYLQWVANTNRELFLIYRNTNQPILSVDILTNSKLVEYKEFSGESLTNSNFLFTFTDKDVDSGEKYFYFVTTVEDVDKGLFYPETNLNLTPLFFTAPFVTNLLVTNYGKSIFIFWDAGGEETNEGKLIFTIYKSTNKIEKLDELSPYVVNISDFYFEDEDIKEGEAYYYAVVVDGQKRILPGKNSTIFPVVISRELKKENLEIIRELKEIKKIKKSEFLKDYLWGREK
jgi:hypothetical protein